MKLADRVGHFSESVIREMTRLAARHGAINLGQGMPDWVPLRPPHWTFDPDELRRAFSPRTKAVILNTPNNPTGHVYTREELSLIAELCQKHDAFALADEIYEYIIHVDRPHVSIGSLPGMLERTVTISGLSKTFSVTGWRLGYCIAPAAVSDGIRKAHDFLTVGAPHPLQMAGVAALNLPESYYAKLKADYTRRRDLFLRSEERRVGKECRSRWWPCH